MIKGGLENKQAVHVVGQVGTVLFAVLLDPRRHRIFFGAHGGQSEIRVQTQKEVEELFEGPVKLGRTFEGLVKVVALVIGLPDGRTVELHPDCVRAEDARKKLSRSTPIKELTVPDYF